MSHCFVRIKFLYNELNAHSQAHEIQVDHFDNDLSMELNVSQKKNANFLAPKVIRCRPIQVHFSLSRSCNTLRKQAALSLVGKTSVSLRNMATRE